MASFFFDSSALVKRYVSETGTVWVTGLIDPTAGNEIYLARIAGVEVVSAIKRRERAGSISQQAANTALSDFRSDFPVLFALLEISPTLISETTE